MTSPLPLRITQVKAHTRSRPKAYLDKHEQLQMEVEFEDEMQRALEDELRPFAATLSDPTLGLRF